MERSIVKFESNNYEKVANCKYSQCIMHILILLVVLIEKYKVVIW